MDARFEHSSRCQSAWDDLRRPSCAWRPAIRRYLQPRGTVLPQADRGGVPWGQVERNWIMLRYRVLVGMAALCLFVGWFGLSAEEKTPAGIVVDQEKRTVTIDAKIAPRKINDPRYK